MALSESEVTSHPLSFLLPLYLTDFAPVSKRCSPCVPILLYKSRRIGCGTDARRNSGLPRKIKRRVRIVFQDTTPRDAPCPQGAAPGPGQARLFICLLNCS